MPSWFVRVEAARERLIQATQQTHWVPAYVKDKRFQNWLENARDWAISRSAAQADGLFTAKNGWCFMRNLTLSFLMF